MLIGKCFDSESYAKIRMDSLSLWMASREDLIKSKLISRRKLMDDVVVIVVVVVVVFVLTSYLRTK